MADLPHRVVPDTQSTLNFEGIDQKLKRVVYVTDYGAKGDGSSNDTPAIQRAINEVGQKGGGRVVFPKGTYYLAQSGTSFGIPWCLYNKWDNIHLDFEPGAILTSDDADAALIFSAGWSKPAGPDDWESYWYGDATTNTYYDISTAAKGDNTLTLTTAAEDSNFAVGDWVYIRTGQLVAARTTEPDAEINQVTKISSGVLTLRWPTAKPYEQEQYDSGTSGLTSVGGASGNDAAFGVAVITDRILHNFKVTGGKFIRTGGTGSAIRSHACVGTVIENIEAEVEANFLDNIESRDNTFCNWRVVNSTTTAGTYKWPFAFGTGCTGGTVESVNVQATGVRMLACHLHEGTAQVTLKDCHVSNTGTGNDLNLLSIRGRAYDLLIKDCYFDNAAVGGICVAVTEPCSGGVTFDNVTALTGGGATNGIYIAAENVTLRNIPDGQNVYPLTGGRAPQTAGNVEYLTATVLFSDKSTPVPLGTLPAYCMPLAPYLDVVTAFNGTGTDRMTIGWSGATTAILISAAALDMGTAGRKDITTAHYGTQTLRYSSTARELIATYTDSAGDASAGSARVVVPYVRIPSGS